MKAMTAIRLADYQPPDFQIGEHHLCFMLDSGKATVRHRQTFTRCRAGAALILNGEQLTLHSITIDGEKLPDDAWQYEHDLLTIHNPPEQFTLETVVSLNADDNKELSGLYRSNGIYCTQCEAEGFRRISFTLDRPDVLATYHVRIEADKATCPVLLSNGNLIEAGELPNGRHYTQWHDPHPKPSYLFALVAGELAENHQTITTPHGHTIDLHIYTETAFIDQTDFAMQSLINAIIWDEQRFNLDYDLNRFNIVAVSDFNMGAMENKSLNIFNSAYILATPETATDNDFHNIERVIGHEYFHNWTGNRITCRDWFQLSLKEGLTVFRDNEFSADRNEAALERINNVNYLRDIQFTEDAGPLAHPVQPQEYVAVDNFYTATVYEKGQEIIRMYHTIIGEEAFQKGMALYVSRHDGQAVRIEDFAQCMQDASGYPFTEQFFHWYTTKHTPHVSFESHYCAESHRLTLTAKQSTYRLSPAQTLTIPIRFSLLDSQGESHTFADGTQEYLWILNEQTQHLTFENIDSDMLPVWLHNFSAPILYSYCYSDKELVRIVESAIDSFARVEAMQFLYLRLFSKAMANEQSASNQSYQHLLADIVVLMRNTLNHSTYSSGEKSLLLSIPELTNFINRLPATMRLNMDVILATYRRIANDIAHGIATAADNYLQQHPTELSPEYSNADAQTRELRSVLYKHLARIDKEGQWRAQLVAAYHNANNMTERFTALTALNHHDDAARQAVLTDFANRFANYPLVIDKWYALQGRADDEGALARIRQLSTNDDFRIDNPNRFRALIASFAQNPVLFHAKDGSGYAFVAEQIRRILPLNPQLSARMLNFFAIAPRLDIQRQQFICRELESLLNADGVSVDVSEIIIRITTGVNEAI